MADRDISATPAPIPQRAQRDRRTVLIVVGLIILTVAAGVLYSVLDDEKEPLTNNEPIGVQTFAYEAGDHADEPVTYAEAPPVGGPHANTWQNCGFYDREVLAEQAVHSLEHGAVWITFQPDLPQEQIAQLRDIAQRNSYVLVSVYASLPTPIVASAWNHQLSFASVTDPRLNEFVTTLQLGPETPELGAPCSGGASETTA